MNRERINVSSPYQRIRTEVKLFENKARFSLYRYRIFPTYFKKTPGGFLFEEKTKDTSIKIWVKCNKVEDIVKCIPKEFKGNSLRSTNNSIDLKVSKFFETDRVSMKKIKEELWIWKFGNGKYSFEVERTVRGPALRREVNIAANSASKCSKHSPLKGMQVPGMKKRSINIYSTNPYYFMNPYQGGRVSPK